MARRLRSTKAATRPAVMAAGAGQTYDPAEDEIAIVRRATEVLGLEHVARWMQSKIPSLGNQTPYTLIKTDAGRGEIERVLLKIEHGVY